MKPGFKILAALFVLLVSVQLASAAALLPNGKQQIMKANGAPCVGCKLYFYIPNTTTPKDTWKDADQGTLNTNPVVLDSLGTAVIYGTGVYRQILQDSTGVTLWDQLTSDPVSLNAGFGGISTGSANAQAITVPNYSAEDGQIVSFIAGFSNTGPTTLNVSGYGPVNVFKDTAAGPQALGGGEIVVGNAIQALYDATQGVFHLIVPIPITSFDGAVFFNGFITPTTLAADQNDWTPTGGYSTANTLRVSSSSAITITGLTGGTAGRTLVIHNVGSFNITLAANDTSSLAANRFGFSAPVTLHPNDDVTIQYDALSSLWRRWAPHSANPIAGGFKNLRLTNGGTPNNQIIGTADAVTLEDSSGTAIRLKNLSCTADVTTTGTFTSTQGSLDSGGVANSTWYSYWFIYNPSTNTPSCLLSTSATSPSFPSGFSFSSRFGWNRTDSSAHFNRVLQIGQDAQYVVTSASTTTILPLLISGSSGNPTTPTYTAASISSIVPSTAARIRGSLRIAASSGGFTTSIASIAPNNAYGPVIGASVSAGEPPTFFIAGTAASTSSANGGGVDFDFLIESSNLYYASNGANAYAQIIGWRDNF
jgi:hypothetical protein